MTYCLCCSNPLLRHIRKNQVFLFCRHCWQEMPERTQITAHSPVISWDNAGGERQETGEKRVLV